MPLHGREQTSHRELLLRAWDQPADNSSMNEDDSKEAQWERKTWPHLAELARNHLGAGIHFQSLSCSSFLAMGMLTYPGSERHHREKDGNGAEWIRPWCSDIFADVCLLPILLSPAHSCSFKKFQEVSCVRVLTKPWPLPLWASTLQYIFCG